MNKTESVSIGRRAFTCEVDAYTIVKAYLERAKKRLASDPDQDEILADLEQAMASHLEEICGGLVVDRKSAEKVVDLLGEVETENTTSDEEPQPSNDSASFLERLGLLFKKPAQKDRSRAILEGVCAGIAKLLMVDPFWVRLLFIVFTIVSQGLGILIYIMLALIMHDEDEDYVGRTAGEVVGTVKERAKAGFEQSARRYEQVLSSAIRKIAKVVLTMFNIALLVILITLGALWSTFLFFMITNPNRVVLFGQNPSLLDFIALIGTGAVLLIPILLLIMQLAGSKLARTVRVNAIFGCLWVISVIVTAGAAVNVVPSVRDRLATETPITKNVAVESNDGIIRHACFTLWGDCRSDKPNIYTATVCEKSVMMVDMTPQELSNMQQWSWRAEFLPLNTPMSEKVYCEYVQTLLGRYDAKRVVFSSQAWNDESYIQMRESVDGAMCPIKPYPQFNSSGYPVINSNNLDTSYDSAIVDNSVQQCSVNENAQTVWMASYFVR